MVVESNLSPGAEADPGYGQLFAVLIRRKFWFLLVFLTCLAMGVVQTKRTPPTFQSSMQLLVEPNYQGKNQGTGVENEFADTNVEVDTATQLNLMRSSQLLQKAVEVLRPQYPDISVDDIKGSLVLTQVVEEEPQEVTTKIFQAQYTANDPVKTQKILKTMRQVYLDYNREQQQFRLAKGLAFIDNQLPLMRQSVVQAESALERFRKTQNLIEPQAQATAIMQTLNNIEQERRGNRAQYDEAQARYLSLQQQLQSSPRKALVASRLSESTRYQSLLGEIQKTELALAQERLRFTDASPSVQQFIEQRQSQLALLQEEVRRVLGTQSAQVSVRGENLLEQGQLGEVDRSLATQLAEAQTNIAAMKAKDETLAQKEQQLRADLKRFPALLAEYNRLEPEVTLKRQTLEQLLKARQELSLDIARGGFDWQVVEEPQLGLQTGPNLKQNLLLAAVAGLILGGVAAFMRETADDAVHTTAELEKQVALPLLGATPKLPPAKKASEPIIELPFGKPEAAAPVTVQVVNWPSPWEALDLIFKNIELLNSVKSLMLTSALAGEGKTTLALGLAVSAARLHKRVLLIDGDLRNPSLHKKLNLPNQQGLSTLLTSDVSIPNEISIQSLGSSYIDILTAGPTPSDPANLLSSPRMAQLIAAFEQSYDLVIVDAPPALGLVDGILTGSCCRGVVLVARIGKVTRAELTETTAMLSKLNVIGVVANGAPSLNRNYLPYTKQQRVALQAVEQ